MSKYMAGLTALKESYNPIPQIITKRCKNCNVLIRGNGKYCSPCGDEVRSRQHVNYKKSLTFSKI